MSVRTLSPNHRKATGAYYTPPELVSLLLDHVHLPSPVLGREKGEGRLSDPFEVLDPAAGQGDLLIPLAERLQSLPRIKPTLYAIDINAAALQTCQQRLGASSDSSFILHPSSFSCADALLQPVPFLKPQSFDLILANPPYVNAIESLLVREYKRKLRAAFPNVKGAADLYLYFLDQATRLVKPGGQIAFILPRAVLNSPAAASIRENLPPYLQPNLVYAPERPDFFKGAAVFICLLILGPSDICKVSTDNDPATAVFRNTRIASSNWWNAIHSSESSIKLPPSSPTLADRFQLAASMTTADAYDALPHITDSIDSAQRLITTGLINPRENLWGLKACRYLRHTFIHPSLSFSPHLTPSLQRRLAQSRRPKILLAGLAKRIEAFLDESGQCIGAVSTFSIYHPTNNIAALRDLLDYLLSEEATRHLVSHLAANALRGRHITLKKQYLLRLPIPAEIAHKWPSPFPSNAV